MKAIILSVSALVLAACVSSPSGSVSKLRGTANVEGYNVSWGALQKSIAKVPNGKTPLIFTFKSLTPTYSKGVTEADWERRAAQTGMAVSDVKTFLGESAYKGPDGELRVCTIHAIQRGLCGKKLGLSIQKRVDFAKRTLALSDRCEWVGFDTGYHSQTAYRFGAVDETLHVAAVCN
ncbi:hypothetical protein [Cognatishimia activa]|uniref:hypothetical protein n=1 Tax=Cognatishimia activa TaxID=1715691 RepID=UPI0022321708|nr:hypothetical protein [Cognatishimia activa]UZD89753.1 hypothetical protein M0D42_09120 [Cognatishimia activa]